eukprot:CAMPEP_0196672244 /NCGR_PEP_ID=MMETSP1090-20130531/2283_1 /TAXON_ID=37098 /ORGANISM="Isochrysis sp, Strain CCMP1244" /LENGTH=104 /DNA_ID=CAMNT_0042009945 /DNA_START=299 /DNA_END=614 /DNA_ORIENTATION=+
MRVGWVAFDRVELGLVGDAGFHQAPADEAAQRTTVLNTRVRLAHTHDQVLRRPHSVLDRAQVELHKGGDGCEHREGVVDVKRLDVRPYVLRIVQVDVCRAAKCF